MLIICAPDSFKESMTASEAARSMERGIARGMPGAQVIRLPMADGGEGTCVTLVEALGGTLLDVKCTDALGWPSLGRIGVIEDQKTAVIEVAAACGIEKVEPSLRDPAIASTRGVGDLIRAALDHEVETIIVGLGGSATNDAGAGMLSALGARFLDSDGDELCDGGAALSSLTSIDLTGFDQRFATVRFRIACDVNNPLLGADGASAVFGPQKGADSETVATLDLALRRWADVVEPLVGRQVRDVPGAGAAGGLGAAFLAFGRSTLESGSELMMDAVGLNAHLSDADLVFTGEGSLDSQTASGKVPSQIAKRASSFGVPTVAFAGRVDDVVEENPPTGIQAVIPIIRGVSDLPTALREGSSNLEKAVMTTCQVLQLAKMLKEY
ncbi:glycerate kinase [Bowdeniella massiliensis]|uniref:glycerate kinase n=1 Tax=Bowdeniella massiliensis TaxID=2932264 RepID=UPI002028176D|nr:glycerate kinase [Bowdeniella massiliensis]